MARFLFPNRTINRGELLLDLDQCTLVTAQLFFLIANACKKLFQRLLVGAARGARVLYFRVQLSPPYRSRFDPQHQCCRIALGRVPTFAQFAQIICNRAQPQLVFGKIDAHFL